MDHWDLKDDQEDLDQWVHKVDRVKLVHVVNQALLDQ